MEEIFNRSFQQVQDDFLWPSPSQGFTFAIPETNLRFRAVEIVLRRIPEDPYLKLTEMIDDFVWFIPDAFIGAKVMPFPCTIPKTKNSNALARVLYLAPALERRSLDVVIASVVHELAHIFLRHNLFTQPDEYSAQEEQAWTTIKAWGFEKEELAHKLFYTRHHSRLRSVLNSRHGKLKRSR